MSLGERRLGVLVSGRGSNLQAILDACADGRVPARVAVVISNVAAVESLARAERAGVETHVIEHRGVRRDAYDARLASILQRAGVELVCLAGFMRVLSPTFIDAFPNRILNIHPSLLPAFPGLDAQRQAWTHGVRVAGATVHLVDASLDGGVIIKQEAVQVSPDETAESLSARILEIEHHLYPLAIAEWLAGGWRIEGRRWLPAN